MIAAIGRLVKVILKMGDSQVLGLVIDQRKSRKRRSLRNRAPDIVLLQAVKTLLRHVALRMKSKLTNVNEFYR